MLRVDRKLSKFLGSSLFAKLEEPVLVIGADTWNRWQLANGLGVTNTHAAHRLTHIAADLGVKNTADLYQRTTPYTFSDPDYRAGVTTLFVMFRAFESKDLNVQKWYVGKSGAIQIFGLFKAKERDAIRRTKGEK